MRYGPFSPGPEAAKPAIRRKPVKVPQPTAGEFRWG